MAGTRGPFVPALPGLAGRGFAGSAAGAAERADSGGIGGMLERVRGSGGGSICIGSILGSSGRSGMSFVMSVSTGGWRLMPATLGMYGWDITGGGLGAGDGSEAKASAAEEERPDRDGIFGIPGGGWAVMPAPLSEGRSGVVRV
jgi:hypothetical protein